MGTSTTVLEWFRNARPHIFLDTDNPSKLGLIVIKGNSNSRIDSSDEPLYRLTARKTHPPLAEAAETVGKPTFGNFGPKI